MSIRVSSRSNKGQNKYLAALQDEEEVREDQDSVRCPVCHTYDYNYDAENDPYGGMIQCDGCNTWQHIQCMSGGKDVSALVDAEGKYYCERCEPKKYPHLITQETSQEQEYVDTAHVSGSDSEDEQGVKVARKRRKVATAGTSASEHSGDAKLRDNAQRMFYKLFDQYIIPDTVEAKLYSPTDDEENIAWEKSRALEQELYNIYKDHKHYTERVRTIFSNLKDKKNLLLKEHVIKGQISPGKLVQMSATELANPDLQEFRERIDEQSLTQLVIEQPDRPRWIKTHKGEELIETQEESPESEIYKREIVSRDTIPAATMASSSSLPREPSKPSQPPPLKVSVQYPEIDVQVSGTAEYLGCSRRMERNPQREALGDGKLFVEGRLSKDKVLNYLREMQTTRTFLLYRLKHVEHCAPEFSRLHQLLWENNKIAGIKNKRSYEKNIYLMPSMGTPPEIVQDIMSHQEEPPGRTSESPGILPDETIFLLTVVKPELVR
ncbi:BYE1 (YKL005C) [Zygosaccharomyces parabailii]|uniref:Transcription factor BYE1 n=1 Tax=Zygosaccharomyces bailii (strain CLIB 213 / ATCC 58445 / CBS 680 / BCRC 21525 / NBRC 1098 / NCYC 1416 / NRRL Y-2227) TaxID=1333698 RepID=A0A8J2X105_ZYGB2|nr:BYE1 (YKL005C) [Zygosaccharomyces parabailii]CDF89993.1 ZYBA0S05-06414g1_1 [Zygosaccharomyces bailii CLIB 213]CDH17749.1 related to Transcription factor BYE1 [Zygosaccharomyces bailii ISA1307]